MTRYEIRKAFRRAGYKKVSIRKHKLVPNAVKVVVVGVSEGNVFPAEHLKKHKDAFDILVLLKGMVLESKEKIFI